MNQPIQKQGNDVVNEKTGQSWVYSSIVKDHFFHPRNLLLEEPAEDAFDARGTVGSPACIAPDTMVDGREETKAISKAIIGQEVYTHDGHCQTVTKIYRPEYKKQLVTIKNPLGQLTATADHLIYGLVLPRSASYFMKTRAKKRVPPAWHHASEYKKGDIVMYPLQKEVIPQTEVSLPECKRKAWDFRSKALPKKLSLTTETLELFGYFVAEGHTKDDGKEVGFTFALNEEAYVQRVQELMQRCFGVAVSYKKRPVHHRIDVVSYHVHLAQLFKTWFGSSAQEKRVPSFVMNLPPSAQAGFIKGVWRGDGYVNLTRTYPRAGFATTSHALLQQMRRLLIRQGIVPSIYQEKEKTVKGVHHEKSYRLHVGDMTSLAKLCQLLDVPFEKRTDRKSTQEIWTDEDYAYLPVRATDEMIWDGGRLYNFEIAKAHTYTTDAFLVHNCGDVMDVWIKVDPKTERLVDFKWKTFGCGSAISATSMFSVMLLENGGATLEEALKVRPQHIMERLGGLPNRKIHCSVLVDKAFRKAVNTYFRATKQYARIMNETGRVVDEKLNITDHDIEEAVLEGATNLEEVQKKLKVGVGSPEAIPDIEQLIRFYSEKYYG